jgi:hypothetical protein
MIDTYKYSFCKESNIFSFIKTDDRDFPKTNRDFPPNE